MLLYFDFSNSSDLDDIILAKGCSRLLVDEAPDTTGQYKEAFVVRMTWMRLYKDFYIPTCARRGFEPYSPSKFCELRSKYRPLYRRHRKVGRKSWHHMECANCVANQAAVDKAKDDISRKKALEVQTAHWNHQEQFRANYEKTIAKVVIFSRFYIYLNHLYYYFYSVF